MNVRRSRWVAIVGFHAVLVAGLVAGTLAVGTAAAPRAQAVDPVPDGATSFTAAASCWEIKQNTPSATDGVYWLVTPDLVAPQQFYCDMTTDGGGWVLIGRGREDWTQQYQGQGSPATLRDTITGTAAFDTVQLPSTTIDGLLNGGRVDALTDGIRLRRARNSTGTQWQEARFNFTKRDRWVWTFPAEHTATSVRFDGQTASGGGTSSFGSDQQYRRVVTTSTAAQGWTAGLAYGSQVTGTNSASTYLWSNTSSTGNARPFTQMFLRPTLRLADLDFPDVPDSGTPAEELTPLAENGALPATWGVSGLANGQTGELDTEVAAFTQIGDVMYVGGNFQYVQRGRNATGADKVEQSYLAAFDVNTGEWIPGFRPVLDGQVKALAATSDGQLIVGGEFGEANGVASPALVALDPTTGATSTSWTVAMENRLTSGVLAVRSLAVEDGWLYVGGSFTHLAGGSRETPVYARAAARVAVTDGTPDANWNPAFDGTVVSVDVSDDGTRLYAAGYFGNSNGQPAHRAAAVTTAPGAALATPAWTPTWSASNRSNYQQTINDAGGQIWVGGSEHSFFSFNPTTFARTSGNITKAGGDLQASVVVDGVIYAGCHCNDWNYSNAYTWSSIGGNWTQGDKIGFVGAWNPTTGAYLPEFNPVLRARNGLGAWALYGDSNGVLWMGGSFTDAVNRNGSNQWAGGFARFAPRDTDAPAAPTALSGTPTADGTRLSWNASSGSGLRYEVIADDRVVATTTSTNIQVPASSATRYFVRAVDVAGNRSASTPAYDATAPSPVLVPSGSDWTWQFPASGAPAGWNEAGFDDSGWASGAAPLGFGSSLVATNVDVPSGTTRPLTAYYRHEFTVDDLAGVGSVDIQTVADDGLVVYVNGVEVGRANMPSGTVGPNTYATTGPRTSTAVANPVTFSVPASLLTEGENVVTAEVHLGWRSTPDAYVDLSMVTSENAIAAPSAPAVTATAQSETSVLLEWTEVEGAASYQVSREGVEPVTVTGETSYLVEGLTPSTSYTFEVTALDRFRQSSAPATASAETPAAEAPPPVVAGSDWSWSFPSGGAPAGWNEAGFDDSGWASGAAPLGFGSTSIATNVDVPSGTTRPLTAYFRHDFTLDDVTGDLTLTTRADDGLVVYVNGVEVGRANMPTGTVGPNTYPTAGPRTSTAVANPVTFTVPVSVLADGANVVSAEVHLGWRSTPDISFDLALEPAE